MDDGWGRSAILPRTAYTLRYGALLRTPVCKTSFPEPTKLLADFQGITPYLLGCLRKVCRGMGKLGNLPLTVNELNRDTRVAVGYQPFLELTKLLASYQRKAAPPAPCTPRTKHTGGTRHPELTKRLASYQGCAASCPVAGLRYEEPHQLSQSLAHWLHGPSGYSVASSCKKDFASSLWRVEPTSRDVRSRS